MLPSANRLKLPVSWNRSPDFANRGPFFKLLAKKGSGEAKIGFVITTKVGKATVRNSLKRKLGEIFSTRLKALTNLEIILILYPTIVGATDEEISASLDKALPKNSF